jgi:hypothetical protein
MMDWDSMIKSWYKQQKRWDEMMNSVDKDDHDGRLEVLKKIKEEILEDLRSY